MRLPPRERAEHQAAFRRMSIGEKLEYIAAYYKLPIILGLIAAVAAGAIIFRAATKKETVLYVGYANVAVGDELDALLSYGFLRAAGQDTRKKEVSVYPGLYLSDDPPAEYHEYSYASRLKLLAAVNARQLDAVLMNREAYDLLSAGGYLLDLREALELTYPAQYRLLAPYLQKNGVVLEDNAIEYRLNEAEEYYEEIQDVTNGIDVSEFPVLAGSGLSDTVYLGVIANTPRLAEAVDYAIYLASDTIYQESSAAGPSSPSRGGGPFLFFGTNTVTTVPPPERGAMFSLPPHIMSSRSRTFRSPRAAP
ncbi:MAG: hypothetical protein IJ705_04955 [Oscillospiraceae bacterium]|nr:hypothetical protein [Oscillospiraceae bacterium]